MDYAQAVSYIRVMRGRGYSDSQITFNLAKSGVSNEVIQKAFVQFPPAQQRSAPAALQPIPLVPVTTVPPALQPVETVPVQFQPVPVVPVGLPPAQPAPSPQAWESTVVTGAPAPQPSPVPVTPWQKFAQMDYEKLGIIPRSKMILSKPREFFTNLSPQGVGTAFIHYLSMMSVTAVLVGLLMLGIQAYQLSGTGMDVLLITALTTMVSTLIGAVVSGAIVTPIVMGVYHLFFKLVGGKATYKSTLKTAFYLSTLAPFMLIPVLGIFVGLYGIWFSISAYARVHQISAFRAFIALVVPPVLLTGLLVVLGLTLFASLIAMLVPLITNLNLAAMSAVSP